MRSELIVGSGKVLNLQAVDNYASFSSSLPQEIVKEPRQYCANWVDYYGTKYALKMLLLCEIDGDSGLPVFGQIQFIVVKGNRIVFVCESLGTVGYYPHVRGFEVVFGTQPVNWFCIEPEELIDPSPLVHNKLSGESFVVLKRALY